MSLSLRTTFNFLGGAPANPQLELVVGNSSFSPNNGGSCCLWTVPANTRYIRFEMWGGGGGGAGACCCQQGCGGSGGSYAVRTLTGAQVVAGCQYTICAAGSTTATAQCCGINGNNSFVTGNNLSNFCARGGCTGTTGCFWTGNRHTMMCYFQCCAAGGDINIHATQSTYRTNNYCYNGMIQMTTVAPATVSGPIYGPAGCSVAGCGDCFILAAPIFPGGGGHSAITHGGTFRSGWWGAPGLVLVTFG